MGLYRGRGLVYLLGRRKNTAAQGTGERVSTKKLVVSTYLQYILIALGALLLLTFVRQIGGVLLTFLLATILAYALNPFSPSARSMADSQGYSGAWGIHGAYGSGLDR